MGDYKIIYTRKGEEIKVSVEDYDWLNRSTWCLNNSGYATATVNGITVSMHRLIMDAQKGQVVDHFPSHDKLDNRKTNLRITDKKGNMGNSRKRKNTSSQFKGVSWKNGKKNWVSKIKMNGVTKNLGSYTCEIEAAKVYNKAATKYYGDFALLNVIPGDEDAA